jgi:S1-C subfamily serine protease
VVKTPDELIDRLGDARPGEKLVLVYSRKGTERQVEVTLTSAGEAERRSGLPRGRPRNRR